MTIHGMPEQFWVVLKPWPTSEPVDLCFASTFGKLMHQVRGGLTNDEIAGIYLDEKDATKAAMRLLGKCPVRPQDAVVAEVIVNVMVKPNNEEMTAKELGEVAVEAVKNAVLHAEKQGHQHRLKDRVSLGVSEVVELRTHFVVVG
jgi:hypothetical protein